MDDPPARAKPQRCIVQIRAPKGDDPGQICEGFYTLDDGLLTMTDAFGEVMKREDGTPFERSLMPEDPPLYWARQMTRQVRRMLRGETEAQEKFRQKIDYSQHNSGWR
jgi:hypothetical protein